MNKTKKVLCLWRFPLILYLNTLNPPCFYTSPAFSSAQEREKCGNTATYWPRANIFRVLGAQWGRPCCVILLHW